MYREEKMSSRVCCKRWQERAYMLHRKKLSDIKPSIDNKTPQMYPHLYQKLKKAQKDEELCSVIERDNRTLVKRMTEIMQRPGIDTHNTIQPKSLNREARRRELLRITQENQKLLRRIQSRQPTYSHLSWEQQRERSETLCERICRYPYRPRTSAEKNLYYYDSPTQGGGAGGSPDATGGGAAAPIAPPPAAAAAPAQQQQQHNATGGSSSTFNATGASASESAASSAQPQPQHTPAPPPPKEEKAAPATPPAQQQQPEAAAAPAPAEDESAADDAAATPPAE
eukprot:Rhum_TRINITY_DN23853_c0_g1::Rhum_TRINITY_DN23853_c0_g1_i1::g.178861::m.178861